MRAVKGKDPMKFAPPVQEYEERKSISKLDYGKIRQFKKPPEWHDLEPCETEEYRDLYQQEQRANKELRHTIEKEMR